MTDDQDLRLGSTDYQSVLHRELIEKGTEFTNHFITTANCCPSRAAFLRGQQAHNTNITHVNAPGGNYDKFVASGQDEDYLPHWLKKAGYRTEYLGKLLNGYNTVNYNSPAPRGWDFINTLTDPYTMDFNQVVMSQNGDRPRLYGGFHQTDIIRAQALDRLDYLTDQKQPFYLTIAPTVPHEQYDYFAPVPLARHKGLFPNATAPRHPNWNPSDAIQQQKTHWIKDLSPLSKEWVEFGDWLFQQRVESLQGIDEIIEDVISKLEEKNVLDNTYNNGWHIGMHRIPAGKATPYAEDTNLPFIVRGPNVPQGVKSSLPGTHIDLAPTFLEIAGVKLEDQPELLDGRSLLGQWHEPESDYEGQNTGVGRELLNVEFWGLRIFEAPSDPIVRIPNNSYKSLRLVGDQYTWLFIKWCNNDIELYNTHDDPWELTNLATSNEEGIKRLLARLNAVLLVTKSCALGTCRDPWTVLQPTKTSAVSSLKEALHPDYDEFYAGLPVVQFKACMNYQSIQNEEPFYPPGAAETMSKFRRSTDNFVTIGASKVLEQNLTVFHGGKEQRHVRWEEILEASRELTEDELGRSVEKRSLDELDILEWYT
ncbi:hypothetical protein ACHAQA_003700 [Verticillium albo-atrum]